MYQKILPPLSLSLSSSLALSPISLPLPFLLPFFSPFRFLSLSAKIFSLSLSLSLFHFSLCLFLSISILTFFLLHSLSLSLSDFSLSLSLISLLTIILFLSLRKSWPRFLLRSVSVCVYCVQSHTHPDSRTQTHTNTYSHTHTHTHTHTKDKNPYYTNETLILYTSVMVNKLPHGHCNQMVKSTPGAPYQWTCVKSKLRFVSGWQFTLCNGWHVRLANHSHEFDSHQAPYTPSLVPDKAKLTKWQHYTNLYACMQSFHHHHHVASPARISLTLSRQPSLSSIAPGRSSGLHPV